MPNRDAGKIQIRLAEIRDYDGMCSLYAALDEHHVQILPQLFQSFDGPRRPLELYKAKIENPDNAIFVAEISGRLIGFADVQKTSTPSYPMFIQRSYALLDNIFVEDAQRGEGIAMMLYEEVSAWAKAHQLGEIRLKVYATNIGAQKFYESLGFRSLASEYTLSVDKKAI